MFQWMLHKTELLTTFDAALYQAVCRKLAQAHIDYRTNWKSNSGAGN